MSDRPDFDGTGLLDRELTGLRDDVADRAQLPDFAAVQARALRRRRARIAAVGSVAAAAALEEVVAHVGGQSVGAASSGQAVIAGEPVHDVVAAERADPVAGNRAVERLGVLGSDA